MPPVGFEPKISTGERPKTYALDRTATGAGHVGCSRLADILIWCKLDPITPGLDYPIGIT